MGNGFKHLATSEAVLNIVAWEREDIWEKKMIKFVW